MKKYKKNIYVNYYVHFNAKESKKGSYWNEFFLYYNTDKKKVVSDKLLSKTYRDDTVDSNIFDKVAKTKDIEHYLNAVGGKDNRLYSYGKNSSRDVDEQVLEEKDLSGKTLKIYVLPAGATMITNNGDDAKLYPEFSFRGFSFGDRYVYYLNRDGVYRCDTEGNRQFELIYDGKNDPVFNPEKGEEKRISTFKVLDNEDFYISLQDGDFYDAGEYLYKHD